MKIRIATKAAGLKLWQVAKAYGMTESSFSRILREELPEDIQSALLDIIHNLKMRLI